MNAGERVELCSIIWYQRNENYAGCRNCNSKRTSWFHRRHERHWLPLSHTCERIKLSLFQWEPRGLIFIQNGTRNQTCKLKISTKRWKDHEVYYHHTNTH